MRWNDLINMSFFGPSFDRIARISRICRNNVSTGDERRADRHVTARCIAAVRPHGHVRNASIRIRYRICLNLSPPPSILSPQAVPRLCLHPKIATSRVPSPTFLHDVPVLSISGLDCSTSTVLRVTPSAGQPTLVLDGMPVERFNVEVASRTLVRASDPPRGFPAVLPVSNLDLVLGSFHVSLIAVYPAPDAGFPAVAAAVRAALPAFLSRLFPFAGRVAANASTGVPEIVCSNAGAELVVADAGVPLADVDFAHADRSLGLVQVPFEQGLALSLQLVRFACGGFSMSWGTDHLLVDGHGLTALPGAWAELLRTGGLSWEPHYDRASLFRPRSPPRYSPSLDAEFTRYAPGNLVNPLLVAALVRRNYVVEAADVDRLCAASSTAARRATRLEALSAHVWKLLAAAVGGSDTHCRLAWLVDGRRRLDPAKYDKAHVNNYLGNVLTYASREAAVETVSSSPLADVAAMAGSAIAEVLRQERYEELVDWMEVHKGVFKEGGKWTETVGVGTGSPALVVSAFLPFRVEGDFGFGRPRLVMPWVRPGRLGSAAMTVSRNPRGDGSWVVSARLWPRLADAVEADPEAVLKPATAARLGFVRREPAADVVQHASRM